MVAAAGVARYVTSARLAGLSLNMTTMSPAPTTAGAEPPIEGHLKTLSSLLAFVRAPPGTKSASTPIAAFGGFAQTLLTDVGKSVWRAPAVPPYMLFEANTCPIVLSAAFTVGWVQGIVCNVSWSYRAGPAWRR